VAIGGDGELRSPRLANDDAGDGGGGVALVIGGLDGVGFGGFGFGGVVFDGFGFGFGCGFGFGFGFGFAISGDGGVGFAIAMVNSSDDTGVDFALGGFGFGDTATCKPCQFARRHKTLGQQSKPIQLGKEARGLLLHLLLHRVQVGDGWHWALGRTGSGGPATYRIFTAGPGMATLLGLREHGQVFLADALHLHGRRRPSHGQVFLADALHLHGRRRPSLASSGPATCRIFTVRLDTVTLLVTAG
jgi:hypothetical protein